jgi:hypothetical protein
MASIADFEVERARIIREIQLLVSDNEEKRRAIAAERRIIESSASEEAIGRARLNISRLEAGIRVNQASIARLEALLAEIDAEIALLKSLPRESVGETAKEAQAANSERANVQSPSTGPLVQNPDGTVSTIRKVEPTNAQPFRSALDIGLDSATKKAQQIQSYQNLANPGPLIPNSGAGNPGAAGTPNSAPGDDARGDNSTRALLREIFGSTGQLQATPNMLDQYASYTYSISIYLMSPSRYRYQLASKKKNLSGYSLIIQSAGAPNTNPNPVAVDPQEIQQDQDGISFTGSALRNLGRNPNFNLDYYIDDVRLKSFVQGRGTRAAHNVFELNFKITEPNGITFIDNLYKAVQEYLTQSGEITGRDPVNYAAQNYLMVIRFYGYDQFGNVITPTRNVGNTTDANAIIEKWIPFQFTNIRFRIANNLTEYECSAVGVQNLASTQQRNSIPYNVELTAGTIKELLSGSANFSGTTAQVAEGATASGLPREARGVAPSAVDQVEAITRAGAAQTAPPKANAAPKTNTPKTLSKGLVDALNQYQKNKEKSGEIEVADEYAIVFKVPAMENARLLPAGPVDKKKPPMIQTTNPQQAKDGTRQSNDFTSQNKSILAGTTIMQFLDQVLRNSSYVTDQQTEKWNEKKQIYEKNGQAIPETAWYTITLEAEPIKYDNIRGDYAYKFTYQISPYLVTDLKSQYFQPSRPWTPPKKYNYWFTGLNTSVLNFTQDYNFLYYTVLSGPNAPRKTLYTDYRTIDKSAPQTRSNESDQGQSGRVFEAPANAADSLYSPSDTIRSKLTIIGDPDWIQQGDLWSGVSGPIGAGDGADFDTVLPDGSINYETREPIYEILFNKPVDYNLNTGLMDVTEKNVIVRGADGKQVSEAQISYVYRAFMVESLFSKGSFTQELEGAQVFFRKPTAEIEVEGRPAANQPDSAAVPSVVSVLRTPTNQTSVTTPKVTDWFKNYSNALPTGARTDSLSAQLAGQATAPSGLVGATTTLPIAAAQPPTSSGQPVGVTIPDPLRAVPASPGSAPTLGLVTQPTPTQQEIIRLQSELDRALSRGNFSTATQITSQIKQLQAQLLKDAPPAPITRTQSIVKDQ